MSLPMSHLRRGLLTATLLLNLTGCGDLLPGIGNSPGGGGGSAAAPPIAGSDIEILGLITALPNAEGEIVTFAQLGVMSLESDPQRYLGGITDARVVAGATEIPLPSTETGGVFVTTSNQSSLRYIPGGTYIWRFTIVDAEGTSQTVTAEVTAPEAAPEFDLDPGLVYYANEPLTIALRNMNDGGIVSVLPLSDADATGPTFNTFAYAQPADLQSARDSLIAVASEPTFTIPASAFPSPGMYRIEVHSYAMSTEALGDRDLPGPTSWVAAGELSYIDLELL